tara:strand:- start:1324 stop:2325 length:1002 start_codon:yes stop_codon:yes gene_type:complete
MDSIVKNKKKSAKDMSSSEIKKLIEKKEKEQNDKTGKRRKVTDQFYTNRDVSSKCIDLLLDTIKIDKENDILLEPSAGEGSFSDYFHKKSFNIEAYDIEPKKEYIKQQDFIEFDYGHLKNIKVHTYGNPPFGRQSSLAKKFIKKAALFSNTIAFILPKSFRKQSFQDSFPLNFHLVEEIDLDKNSFTIDGKTHNVPCIFQIWIKKEEERYIEPKSVENGFHFVKRPTLKDIEFNDDGRPIKRENIFSEQPDFGILRAGGGNSCGRISLEYNDGIACYPEAWLFIKIDDNFDKKKFYDEYQKINWIDDSNVGARSIDKQRFIKGINGVLASMMG